VASALDDGGRAVVTDDAVGTADAAGTVDSAGARRSDGGAVLAEPVRPLRERANELLEVPGRARMRAAVRGTSALAVLSLAGGALGWGAVGLALMALVLLGVTLARVLRLPGGLQLLLNLTLVLAAWAALLELYQRWWWLDMVVHVVATALLAVLAVLGLLRARLLGGPPAGRAGRLGLAVVTLAVGLGLAVVWELGEWAGHTYLDRTIFVSYDDTIGDLAAGGAGSTAAGAWLARRWDDMRAWRGPA